jgi:catechol 2,3-dioxygenase-like lactoylglutathione lyase family enzyme
VTRLWLPFTVADLPAAVAFYRDRLGLPVVDGWSRDGEEGVVPAAGPAFVELVAAGGPGTGPLAFEVTDVAAALARLRPRRRRSWRRRTTTRGATTGSRSAGPPGPP